MGLTDSLATGAVIVLDGGLATRLEARGHDLSGRLWSARLLLDAPDEVHAAHVDFATAGAQVAITASYQLSFEGLATVGVDEAGTRALVRRSVELARAAMAPSAGWVAASVGPYGASLADGSEYTGTYAVPASARGAGATGGEPLRRFLRDWHSRRLSAIADSGPDLLAVETIPCLDEAEVLIELVARTGIPAWVSVSCVGDRLRSGEPARAAFEMVRGVEAVIACGVNCTTPADAGVLAPIASAASGKPVVLYPNSGETWDPAGRTWTGRAGFQSAEVRAWLGAGAQLVGGCCRVTPDTITDIARVCAVAVAPAPHPRPTP